VDASGQFHAPAALRPGKMLNAHCTHWIGGCLGSKPSLDAAAKKQIPTLAGDLTPVIQPVAWSLYWLSYPDPLDRWADR